jgi:hypothetical protein
MIPRPMQMSRLPAVPRPALLLTGLIVLAAVPVASAATTPVTVTEQLGSVRQVVTGDGFVAWTRCAGPQGPTEIWSARTPRGRARKVAGIRVAGICEPIRLAGTWRGSVVAFVPDAQGLRSLEVIDLTSGARRVLDQEVATADGRSLVAADTSGPQVAWLRSEGPPGARATQALVVDLRLPQSAPGLAYSRSLVASVVVPTGIWVNSRGEVAVREVLSGAQYGYGSADQRVSLIRPGRPPLKLTQVTTGGRIVGGDLGSRWFVYSIAREDGLRVWVNSYDITTKARRVLRVSNAASAKVSRDAPALPSPVLGGSRAAWRERTRAPGGYIDRIRVYDLGRKRLATPIAIPDSAGQRLFLSPPALGRRTVAWAQVRLATASGADGGFLGLPPTGARSRLVTAPLR